MDKTNLKFVHFTNTKTRMRVLLYLYSRYQYGSRMEFPYTDIYIYCTFDGEISIYVCRDSSVLRGIQKATNVDHSDK